MTTMYQKTNTSKYVYIYAYTYIIYMWGTHNLLTGSLLQMTNYLEGPTIQLCIGAGPNSERRERGSEARHARSEATRLVTVNCTSH